MVEYFCDSHELHKNHRNFCHEKFLTALLSTDSKSQNDDDDESQKSDPGSLELYILLKALLPVCMKYTA